MFTKKVGKAPAFTAPVAPKKVFGVKQHRTMKAGGGATGPVAPSTKKKGINIQQGHI